MPRFRDWADIFRDASVSHRAFYTPATGRLKHSERSQDGRMTKKCRVRLEMHSLALHFFVILPSCCERSKPPKPLYANVGDLQNPGMATVAISPQRSIEGAYPYEMMDYADITYFLTGNATLPPMVMKPKRPSKKKIIKEGTKNARLGCLVRR